MWFASFSDYEHQPWLVHLLYKLLRGDRSVEPLFAHDPFPRRPPRYVRASFYRYDFTNPGEPGWWRRRRIGEYIRPVSLDDPDLRAFLESYGWR
jgi:hypothetical protein